MTVHVSPVTSFGITPEDLMFWGENLSIIAKKPIVAQYNNCPTIQMETVCFRRGKHTGSITVRPLDDGSRQHIVLRFKGREYRTTFSFVNRKESIRNFIKNRQHFEVKA